MVLVQSKLGKNWLKTMERVYEGPVRCGYCYSCHWKMEESGRANSAVIDKYSRPATRLIEQPLAEDNRNDNALP